MGKYYKQNAFKASTESGLAEFLFAPVSEFSAIQVAPSTGTSAGETAEITTAHTFTASNDGFVKAKTDNRMHSIDFKDAGELGSKVSTSTAKVRFKFGSEAEMLEFVREAKNDEFITLHKTAKCGDGMYMQLGCACQGATISFDGKTGTLKDGSKYIEGTVEYFGEPVMYSASVDLAA